MRRLDLLIVALPPFAHSGQVEQAVAAGMHVLVEKPIALDMTRARVDGRCGREGRRRRGVRLHVSLRRGGAALGRSCEARAKPDASGLFTGQFHCNALHADWWRERAKSGGQMVEQLIHIVDLARHQLGEPQSVYARTANFFHRDVAGYDSDDVSAIVLGYADGRVGVLNATNGAVPGQWNKLWQIVAERMTGRFTGWNTATLTHTVGAPRTEEIDEQTDVFVAQLADVAAAIRDKRPPSVPLERRREHAAHRAGRSAIGCGRPRDCAVTGNDERRRRA